MQVPNPTPKGHGLNINAPIAGSTVVVDNGGTVAVSATRTNTNIVKMFVKIFHDEDPQIPRPGDALPCDVDPTNGQCHWPAVPVAQVSLVGTENTVAVWGEKADKSVIGNDAVDFTAQQKESFEVVVSAKHCIWLAWAPPEHPDPPFEERGPVYQPSPIAVPTDKSITHVTIVANPDDQWAHHSPAGNRKSDAAGLVNDQRNLERSGYQSEDLRSKNIVGTKLPLNMLVTLLGINPNTRATEIGVGLSKTLPLDVDGQRPTSLFLAFHDGHQWTNNNGEVSVTVSWHDDPEEEDN